MPAFDDPKSLFDDRAIDTVHKAIIFENVSIGFEDIPVLEGVSFELRRGETKVIMGVAGSGKSTILKLCLGLLKPARGHIPVPGHDITTITQPDPLAPRSQARILSPPSAPFHSPTAPAPPPLPPPPPP